MGLADRTDTKTEYAEGLALTARSGGPGQPGLCPACQYQGHLDVIVPGSNSQFESCPACRCEWKRMLDYEGSVEIVKAPAG